MSQSNIARPHDWPERLAAFVDSRRQTPFRWGENDCGLFAADAVLAMTGVDLAARLRGYKTERGALSRISKAGGTRGLVAHLPEKRVGFACRGDIVLVTIDGRESFGIVSGNGHWCAPGISGLVFRPMADVIAAFGI